MSPSTSSRRSWPAENAGPLAASTIARTSGSALSARRASFNSRIISLERALRFSGRFMVMVATGASRSTRMESYVIVSSPCGMLSEWLVLAAWYGGRLAVADFLLQGVGDVGGDDAIEIASKERNLFEQRRADEEIAQVRDNHQRLDLRRELAVH